jgi:threonine/homoserine/homoserine lactone efflux protein
MSWYGLGVFCTVYLLAVATPGPGVTAILARSLTHGMRGAPVFIAGFLVGDLIWFTGAVAGLAAIAQTAQNVFLIVRYAGAAYLLYLACKLWTAPAKPLQVQGVQSGQRPLRLFLGSLSLALGNPKPMIFFIALLPTVVPLRALHFGDYAAITLSIAVILPLNSRSLCTGRLACARLLPQAELSTSAQPRCRSRHGRSRSRGRHAIGGGTPASVKSG